jgi:SAM-dependent methyltransferase
MRKLIREYLELVVGCFPLKDPIYEFGSYQVPGQEDIADLRPLFPGFKYVGTDMREGTGVDEIQNLHNLTIPDGTAATALALDTLEHVEYCRKAMAELYRVLEPDGLLVISSHMNYPIHAEPDDYWRFTPEAFRSLLKDFNVSLVHSAGKKKFPHTVVATASKGALPHDSIEHFEKEIASWSRRWESQGDQSLSQLLLPPILYGLDRKVKRWLKWGSDRGK